MSVKTTEHEIATAVLKIAAGQQDGIATFHRIRREVPKHVSLSSGDRQQSQTRPNEELWEQRIRNIQSHHNSPGNFIYEGYLEHVTDTGYRITDAGRKYLDA